MNVTKISHFPNSSIGICSNPPPLTRGIDYKTCLNKSTFEEAFIPESSDTATYVPSITLYTIAFVFGIFANLVIIYALYSDTKFGNSVTANRFLISLAIADTLFLLFCAPYEILIKYTGYLKNNSTFSYLVCKMFVFTEMATAAASVFNLTAVSFERYVVIVHPIKARDVFTKTKSVILILIVWIVAALVSLPTLYIWRISTHVYYRYDDYRYRYYCANYHHTGVVRRAYAWYRLLVLYLIPLTVMAFCYTVAIRVLSFSTVSLTQMTSTRQKSTTPDVDSENGKKNCLIKPNDKAQKSNRNNRDHDVVTARKQLMRMLMAVIALFVLSWGPKLIWDVFEEHHRIMTDQLFDFSIYVLPYIQSALNPVIYFTMSRSIRSSIMKCVKRKPISQHGTSSTFHSSIRYKESMETANSAF